ncbi:hypothetical protein [Algibacillus agarilyticus]|uniref:hypothetical protein n=1 Tax=Algibacillus agarilyticus TaxID=2234133 RepID=UPI000DD0995E|nr:hypothetical protein [Algibacillus agarilyticus]
MLFCLAPNTPKFEIFKLLNEELLHFLEQSVNTNAFCRALLTQNDIGKACWGNGPTRAKYRGLFNSLQAAGNDTKLQLFEAMRDNQDLQLLFAAPQRNLFDFMSEPCFTALKTLCTHLYCSTKGLDAVIAAGCSDIKAHFNAYRAQAVNGNICKACGMEKLAPFRAEVPDGEQWRADYDHQLCKSKYPIFAVHPDNLIPLCDVCNQDAKKAKDLFKHKNGTERLAFYPYTEGAKDLIDIVIDNLRDPEPTITVNWNTQDAALRDKLKTWDEVYEIRSRVEGQFRSLEAIIGDELRPRNSAHLVSRISDEARPHNIDTLKRKEWAFWHQKLFRQMQKIGEPDIEAFWARQEFTQNQAASGADFILNG